MLVEIDTDELYERVAENFPDFVDWVFFCERRIAKTMIETIKQVEKAYNKNANI